MGESRGGSPSFAPTPLATRYTDLTETTNIEVGGSYARKHNENGSRFITADVA